MLNQHGLREGQVVLEYLVCMKNDRIFASLLFLKGAIMHTQMFHFYGCVVVVVVVVVIFFENIVVS